MANPPSISNREPNSKTLELDCGIAPSRIIPWLEKELALEQTERGSFRFEHEGDACTATVEPLGKSGRGHFALERTQLVISGSEAAVDALMLLFTLRFLSAGG